MNATELASPIEPATVCLVTGIIGAIVNILAFRVLRNNGQLKTAFGMLCCSHIIANLGIMIIFLGYVVPLTFLPEIENFHLSKHFGQVGVFFWNVCVYSHLFISLNRLIAISFPLKGSAFLDGRWAKRVNLVIWVMGFLHATPYFDYAHCFLAYDSHTFSWYFAETACGEYISTYFDYYAGMSVMTAIISIDIVTLIMLHYTNKKYSQSFNDIQHRNARRREVRMFVQAVAHGLVFIAKLMCFYFVYQLNIDSTMFVFYSTTFAWEACHAMDGNAELSTVSYVNQLRIVCDFEPCKPNKMVLLLFHSPLFCGRKLQKSQLCGRSGATITIVNTISKSCQSPRTPIPSNCG